MITKQIRTVLLLAFIFFNVSLKAQWTGSWSCLPNSTPNGYANIIIQNNVLGESGALVDTWGSNGCEFFTNITGTTAICVPNNFTVTARLLNPPAPNGGGISEYDTHLTLLDANNPTSFLAKMRVDGDDPSAPLMFANVGVNNSIPPCCNVQEITDLIRPDIEDHWTNLTIQVNGTQVTFFINGTALNENNGQPIVRTLSNPVCSIIPQLNFKGRGLVDDLQITDLNTNTVIYHETFNSLQFAQPPSCSDITTSPYFTGPNCGNNNLQLFANPAAGQTYTYAWSGPNGFTSNLENPVIPNPTSAAVGAYTLVASYNACNTVTQTVNVNFQVPDCYGCSDTCYWKVSGNNILNGRNIFGTLSNNDIRIFSNNTQRGTITSNGYFGWQTTSPSTIFDVDCFTGFLTPSGLRFQNLPRGFGETLVVDGNGYVYRQRNLVLEFRQEIDSLENEITALRSLVNSSKSGNIDKKSSQNTLSQNKPNPFSDVTTIDCYVAQMKSNAFIAIYDLTGKELMKYRVNGKGHNSVQVNSETLVDGMYIYSLIIDGEEVASKKMVISR